MVSKSILLVCDVKQNLTLQKTLCFAPIKSIKKTTIDYSAKAISNVNYNTKCKSDYEISENNILERIASGTLQIEPKDKTLNNENTELRLLIYSGFDMMQSPLTING